MTQAEIALALRNKKQLNAFTAKVRAFQLIARASSRHSIQCVDCGDRRWDVLQAHHVGGNGSGAKHRRRLGKGGNGAGNRIYLHIIRRPRMACMFELLCANCHQLRTIYKLPPEEIEELFAAEGYDENENDW